MIGRGLGPGGAGRPEGFVRLRRYTLRIAKAKSTAAQSASFMNMFEEGLRC